MYLSIKIKFLATNYIIIKTEQKQEDAQTSGATCCLTKDAAGDKEGQGSADGHVSAMSTLNT